MTNLKNLAIAVLVSVFAACSSDNAIEDTNIEDPLKSYSLSRDANGNYSLEHTVANGINSRITKENGVNKITLNEGDNNSITQKAKLALQNGEIKIDFVTHTSLNIPGLILIDEDITTAKGKAKKETSFLESHGISLLENGTYQLDFTVANNVQVSFEYNEEFSRHQIRLRVGENNGITTYSKNYTKLAGQKLTIAFIHMKTGILSSKTMEEEEEIGPPVYEATGPGDGSGEEE